MTLKMKVAFLCLPSKTSTSGAEPEVSNHPVILNICKAPWSYHILVFADVRPNIYSSEEDASDIEDRKAKKMERPKALRDSDEEDGGDDEAPGGSGTSKARAVSSSEEDSD